MANSSQIFEKIRQHLEAGGVAPTPANYEFWYRYVTGTDPVLVDAVDSVIASTGRVSARAMHNIRREIYSDVDITDINQLIVKTQQQLQRMSVYVGQANADAHDGEHQPNNASINSKDDEDGSQRMLLTEMVNATNSIINKAERLEAQLATSGEEIDTLKRALETARAESRTDPLTGLPNRKAFTSYLEAQASRATADRKPLSLAFCDIDHFKNFNDTWGHAMGDEVLRLVGQNLEQLSQGIGYPARYGGEEFCIVLPGKSIESAVDICEQIRDFIASRSVRAKSSNCEVDRITLSLGIAQLRWTDSIDTLIERADAALYKAKETGRNKVCDESELDDDNVSANAA